jgi:hypothetical protein
MRDKKVKFVSRKKEDINLRDGWQDKNGEDRKGAATPRSRLL